MFNISVNKISNDIWELAKTAAKIYGGKVKLECGNTINLIFTNDNASKWFQKINKLNHF